MKDGYNMINTANWSGMVTSQHHETGSYDWFLINMWDILHSENPDERIEFAKDVYKKKHNLTEREYLNRNNELIRHRTKVFEKFFGDFLPKQTSEEKP